MAYCLLNVRVIMIANRTKFSSADRPFAPVIHMYRYICPSAKLPDLKINIRSCDELLSVVPCFVGSSVTAGSIYKLECRTSSFAIGVAG